jgi:hypothetical protein
MRRRFPAHLVFSTLIVAACAAPLPEAAPPPATPGPAGDTPQQACTRIGCDSGWIVEIADPSALPQSYTVRVLVGGSVVASAQCSASQPCGDRVFLSGVTAEEATLEITGAAVPLRWTVRPEYTLLQPNGPQCPPTCRQARVQVRVSG